VGNGKGVNIQKKGQVRRIFAAQPEQIITAEYRSPIGVHAQMEPNGGIADVKAGKAKVICGTQSVAKVVKALEDVLGFSDDRIEVVNTYLGGAFGRRLYRHKVVDAARISKRIGKPVHAFRTREEEFLNAYYRPNNHHVMYATLKDGRIEAIEHLQASDDMWVSNNMPAMRSIMGSDFPSANHGARIFYPVANRSTSVYDIELPFPTGVWRGVGAWLNYFATESFMDELALAAQADPVAFRLAHLQGQEEDVVRLRKVVERVQERSGWDQPLPEGVGRGFAIAEDRRTVVAMAVEVRIVKGMVRVSKVTCGMDAGTIVNPEGARTQVEGCIMMGISAALYEELTIKDSQFTASNFHEYPIATLMDTPEMEILMIEGREQPSGVGEPPIAPVAPAIANAIFDLTGKRLRNIPLRV
ncbi:MAG: molybdopterin cofactor-binding domain-containing protein, partial [Bacteroidota bacterium]